jgi:excisionase family DNA binding protein
MDAARPLLTIRETATLLALSKRTIHRYIAEGKLKAYRVGGEKTIRIKREDVEGLLELVLHEARAVRSGVRQPRVGTKKDEGRRRGADV